MSGDYFGPPRLKKEWERQVATPVGRRCLHCKEPVAEGDIGTIDGLGNVLHYECGLRGVVGPVAHQEKRCSCYGGSDEHGLPEGRTARQEAIAAARLWERTHG